MDEPTEGLAPLLVREVGARDRRAQARGAVHPARRAESAAGRSSVADRVHVLSRGQIVYSGTPAELMPQRGREDRAISGWPDASFGTFFFFQAPPGQRHADIIRRELEQMEWTEELGFDEVWLTEHHFIDYGLSVDPATLACAAASRTRAHPDRPGGRHPALPPSAAARRADGAGGHHLQGSARRGGGARQPAAGVRGYRVPQEESRERFDEAVEIMQRAWTEERFSYDGRFFQLDDVRVIPKPMQQPHPPVYQVCVSQGRHREHRAARLAHAQLGALRPASSSSSANRDTLRDDAAEGRPERRPRSPRCSPAGASRARSTWRDTDAQALAEAKDAEMWYQESFRKFVIPERIEDSASHAAAGLPRHGRAAFEDHVGGARGRDARLRLAGHGGAAHRARCVRWAWARSCAG